MEQRIINKIPIIALMAYIGGANVRECFKSGIELVCT